MMQHFEVRYECSWHLNKGGRIDRDEAGKLLRFLSEIKKGLEGMELHECILECNLIDHSIREQSKPGVVHLPAFETLFRQLRVFRLKIIQVLNYHGFVYIPKDRTQYLEQSALFGPKVFKKFRSARCEIKDAGNCLATDLNEATIFYLMRATEHGMRALAKHLGAKTGKYRKATNAVVCTNCDHILKVESPASFKPTPIDYAMWEEVVSALEKKVAKLKSTKKGDNRDKKYEFYHGLLIELNAFKDLWRNPVSHCRRPFDEHEAQHAFNHVKQFMQCLATKVKE